MKNILIIGAHFDDAELGAGGTLAKLVSQGKKVYKYTLTDNETRFEQRNVNVEYGESKKQSALAAKTLGIIEIENPHPVPCSTLMYGREIMQQVEKIIFEYDIDTVFIHFDADMNQDHVEASRICLTAARHCRNILEFQSNGYVLDNEFTPTYFVDISDFIEQKKQALACYGTEHDRLNRLFTTAIERNHIRGYANEVEYAEGFRLIKMLEL